MDHTTADAAVPPSQDAVAETACHRTTRPAYAQWRNLGLVGVGGAIGTGLREALSLWFPPIGGVPITTLVINIVGAGLLGFLLETLVRRGGNTVRRRRLQLFAGTGLLGGFTTYSALSVDTALLLERAPLAGLAYGLGSLGLGLAATVAGIALAVRLGRGADQ